MAEDQGTMGASERQLLEQLLRQVAIVKLGVDDVRTELRVELNRVRDELRAEMHGIRDELRADIRGTHLELRELRHDITVFAGHLETQRQALSEYVDRRVYAARTEFKDGIAEAVERLERRVDTLEQEATARRTAGGGS